MGLVKKMFSGISKEYLIKAYFISIILTFLAISGSDSLLMGMYAFICGILFPFASVVWDDLINTLLGNNFIILPILVLIIWKFFKVLMLFIFTPFIAPIGFIYIYFANGYHKNKI